MPLYIVKSPREAGKTWLLGPYPEQKIENIRATAQIHSARGKNTSEVVWKCKDRDPVVLYVYEKGVVLFPKGTPGNRDSKRGKDIFSCVFSSGGTCALPANMSGEDAVKGRRKALAPACPVNAGEIDRKIVAKQQRAEKPKSVATRESSVVEQMIPKAASAPLSGVPQTKAPVKTSLQGTIQLLHEANRAMPNELFDRKKLTRTATSYLKKRPELDPIFAVVAAKVDMLKKAPVVSHPPQAAASAPEG